MKYLKIIDFQDKKIKSLKKENKLLKEKLNAYNKCIICGSKDITKHSLSGNHKPPFVNICLKHHKMIEDIKTGLKVIKGEKNYGLSVSRFKKIIKTFT